VRARNGRAFVIGALAALGCGAVIMPIHHQMKPDELSDMLATAPLCAILDDGSGAPYPGKTIALENPGANGCVSRGWTIPSRRSRRESRTRRSCASPPARPARPKAWCSRIATCWSGRAPPTPV
jgi:acyl-coenzyme A synthetase/AMP-(fatty) acid ligase